MAVITISRQLGSGGLEIARQVAGQLGYRLVWRELINQAALRSGAPEAALAAIDELGLLGMCPSPKDCLAYRQAVAQIMQELANQGQVVIVGRAGQVILQQWPETLHVRLFAPTQKRAERVAQVHNIPLPAAHAQIEASDRYRTRYLRRYYHVRWDNPELYDLILNTGRLNIDQAAQVICKAAILRDTAEEQLPTSPDKKFFENA